MVWGCALTQRVGCQWPHFHGHLKPSVSRSVMCSRSCLVSMGTLKPPYSRSVVWSRLRCPSKTPVIHVPLSGRVGGTLPHKSYSSLSWEDQTAKGHLHGQSPRSRLRGDWSIWTQGRRRRYRPAPLPPSAGRRNTQTCKQLATRAA